MEEREINVTLLFDLYGKFSFDIPTLKSIS